MDECNPITPTHQLLQQWNNEAIITKYQEPRYTEFIATRAANWGADQELEACCEWLNGGGYAGTGTSLRAARRPKPPSLAEQALANLDRLVGDRDTLGVVAQAATIRRALERLQEMEGGNDCC